jgi:ATP-binding cassette subfamily C protein
LREQNTEESLNILSAKLGEPIEVGSDKPMLLTGRHGWLISGGAVDVFSVAVAHAEAVGSRKHLFRAETGQMLLGLGNTERPFGLVAVGTSGTRLIRIEPSKLDELLADSAQRAELSQLVDLWVGNLYHGFSKDVRPPTCQNLEPGETEASETENLRPEEQALWLRRQSGLPLLLGESALELDGEVWTPLAHHGWLEMPPESQIRAHDTGALLDQGLLRQSLDHFHDLYLDVVVLIAERTAAAERERLRLKTDADRMTLQGACELIAKTLTDREIRGETEDLVGAPGFDPLLAACRVVGNALDLAVKPALRAEGGVGRSDPLSAIARASRFRIRQVILREGWWRHDSGPMLGYTQDDKRPVALLPTRSGEGFIQHDPETGTEEPVTASVANRLEPFAFAFYRPFPQDKISLTGLVRFGFHGCRGELTVIGLMGLATGLLGFLTPMATREIFNEIIPGAARGELLQITLVLIAIAFATTMFNATGTLALVRLEGKTSASIQGAVWDRLLTLPVTFFRPFTAGNLASRAMSIETMRQVFSGQMVQALVTWVFSLFQFILLFYYSAELAWWAVLLIAIAVVVTLGVGQWQVVADREAGAIRNRLAGTVLQFLGNVSKLRIAGAEVRAFAVWARGFSRQRKHQYEVRSRANLLTTFNMAFPIATNILIYAMATPLLTDELSLPTGDFLAFMASFNISLRSMIAASDAINLGFRVVPLFEQAEPILETLPETEEANADPGRLEGNIDLHQVSFRYEEDGPTVLQDITLSIGAGEFVALVGPSGSGKSTLLRLLLGFEEPLSGSIYYGRQDLAGLDRHAVRTQIGVVLQNGRLLSGDIFSNIIGSSRSTLDEAWEAARMAGLDDDINAMPMGMHTVINEGGGTLSGGQRQRLMIARALVQRPRMLFFDEATSALDNRNQDIVTRSLDDLQATRIVIAHRLSTIKNADRIYVLDGGRIVESGDFEDLMEHGGVFRELAERQMA